MQYRCGKCGQTKAETEFAPSQRKPGTWCRVCMRKKQAPHPSRPCEQCGSIMEDPNPRARFCGVKCKNDEKIGRESARRAAVRVGRTCAQCGIDISHQRIDTKWCSDRCGVAGRGTRKAIARRARLKAKYGIAETEYERLLRTQRGKCAICKGADPFQAEGVWAVDHDHVTGQVRGLLCSKCNTGIGQLRDDPDILAAASRYIRKHRQMVLPM